MDRRAIGCGTKHAFWSKPEAERAAKRMRRAHDDEITRVFRCPFCRRWHLAHGYRF